MALSTSLIWHLDEIASMLGAMDSALANNSALLASSNEHACLQFNMIGPQIHKGFDGMADL